MDAAQNQRRGHGGAQREAAVGSDVGKAQHARREIHAPRQRHVRESLSQRGPPQGPRRIRRGRRRRRGRFRGAGHRGTRRRRAAVRRPRFRDHRVGAVDDRLRDHHAVPLGRRQVDLQPGLVGGLKRDHGRRRAAQHPDHDQPHVVAVVPEARPEREGRAGGAGAGRHEGHIGLARRLHHRRHPAHDHDARNLHDPLRPLRPQRLHPRHDVRGAGAGHDHQVHAQRGRGGLGLADIKFRKRIRRIEQRAPRFHRGKRFDRHRQCFVDR